MESLGCTVVGPLMSKLATKLSHTLEISDDEFNLIGHALQHYAMSPRLEPEEATNLRDVKDRERAMNLSTEMYEQRARFATLLEERLNDHFGTRGLPFCTCITPNIEQLTLCSHCKRPSRDV